MKKAKSKNLKKKTRVNPRPKTHAEECLGGMVEEILGKDGTSEFKRLILEKRLPVSIDADTRWCQIEHDAGSKCLAGLILEKERCLKMLLDEGEEDVEFGLRFYIAYSVASWVKFYDDLIAEMAKQNEKSLVLERKVQRLRSLNTSLPLYDENGRVTDDLNPFQES